MLDAVEYINALQRGTFKERIDLLRQATMIQIDAPDVRRQLADALTAHAFALMSHDPITTEGAVCTALLRLGGLADVWPMTVMTKFLGAAATIDVQQAALQAIQHAYVGRPTSFTFALTHRQLVRSAAKCALRQLDRPEQLDVRAHVLIANAAHAIRILGDDISYELLLRCATMRDRTLAASAFRIAEARLRKSMPEVQTEADDDWEPEPVI